MRGRLSKTGVELSREARVRLAWMDFYRRCGKVAHTGRLWLAKIPSCH
ncbi:MAG: hypothetical protein WA213_12530 [Terriglobales bacterium]